MTVTIGPCTLYLGDCRQIVPTLSGVDAVVTDPPYGIGEHGGACRNRNHPQYARYENRGWDIARPEWIGELQSIGSVQVIWGGNYFADLLKPTMGWLYWRKLMGGDFSDGELAWTSRNQALREFVKCPKGMDKAHPCEKPVPLMEWCLDQAGVLGGQTVLDPFMGSGSTAIACVRRRVSFIGIEIDPHYFQVACDRIQREVDQFTLPLVVESRPVSQPALL